jgi:hypothetical protein
MVESYIVRPTFSPLFLLNPRFEYKLIFLVKLLFFFKKKDFSEIIVHFFFCPFLKHVKLWILFHFKYFSEIIVQFFFYIFLDHTQLSNELIIVVHHE